MNACQITANELACQRGRRLLFAGLSLRLKAGEACRVTGPNGMGKSSLIRILAGLLRPFAGSVNRTGQAALLDERPALDEHRSLGQTLNFWAVIDGTVGAVPLTGLGLSTLLDVPVRFLSTGQRKRAAIARLLGQNAPIWLLDEPLNGLDTAAGQLVEQLVTDHCHAGGIALIASHQPFALAGMHEVQLTDFGVGARHKHDE